MSKTLGEYIKGWLFGVSVVDKYNEAYGSNNETTTAEADLSIKKLPFLKGSNNKSALGYTIPYVMGRNFFTPYKLNEGFYSITGDNGEKHYYNVPLIAGYNNQRLESISIGDTVIKTFDTTKDISQDGVYNITSSLGDIQLEIANSGELGIDGLNQKVIGQYYGVEVKHDFGKNPEAVIEPLAENPLRAEICIKFDGLRAYDENGVPIPKSVNISAYWSNNASAAVPDWSPITFDVVNDGSTTYQTVTLTQEEKQQALENGYIKASPVRVQYGRSDFANVNGYHSNNSEYIVNWPSSFGLNTTLSDFEVLHREPITSGATTITRNTKETCRFVAFKTFTPEEAYGKSISIKVVKDSVTEESNTNETCILEYVNTYCYDPVKSSDSELVACMPLEQPFRDQTLRIGLKVEANDTTNNLLEELNIITVGCARTYNGSRWNAYREPTSNPASWLLDVLTSNYHNISKYSDSEIDLNSLGELYNYCNTNNLECNGVITNGAKKSDILNNILSLCFSSLIRENGLIKFYTDKPAPANEDTPLLNEQNISAINYAKTFERELTGYKVNYTDRKSWKSRTDYFFKEENHSYNQLTDTLSELTLNYVTDYEHAYKITQRELRKSALQPRTITASIGLEGEKYKLYSNVLVSIPRFKKGLVSTVIHEVIYNEAGLITGFTLADKVEFVSDYRYGLIVQAQNDNARNIFKAEITGSGKTNEVSLVTPVNNSVVINYGNIASVGLLNADGSYTTITDTYRIVDKSPTDGHGWSLTLKDYNAELYNYGNIPAYTSNLSSRPTTAVSLPTLTRVDLDEAKFSNWAETKELVADLEKQIEGITTDTTVCDLDLKSGIIEIDGSGNTLTEQSFSTNISLKHNESELDFIIDSVTALDGSALPEGFSYSINGKSLTITVGSGVKVKSGSIKISVKYYPVSKYIKYVDKNGKQYVDKNNRPYASIEYSSTYTEWPLYFSYMASGLSVYLGSFSQLSQIPAITNIGDYFVWAGENRKASSLAYDGYFLQAQTYKFVGTSKAWKWEVETNSGHMQSALSDVLAIANADLEHNNSTVWAYLDHLTANSVYCGMLVANEAFIENIAAKMAQFDIVTTNYLTSTLQQYEKIQDLQATLLGFTSKEELEEELKKYTSLSTLADTLGAYPTNKSLAETLKSYYTSNQIDDKGFDTVKARNEALNDYVQSTSIFGSDGHIMSSFASESIAYALLNDKPVVTDAGYINTDVLSADVITTTYIESDIMKSKYVSTESLTTGDLTVNGLFNSKKGYRYNNYLENTGSFTDLNNSIINKLGSWYNGHLVCFGSVSFYYNHHYCFYTFPFVALNIDKQLIIPKGVGYRTDDDLFTCSIALDNSGITLFYNSSNIGNKISEFRLELYF